MGVAAASSAPRAILKRMVSHGFEREQLTLLPDGQDAVVLVGVIQPPPSGESGVWVYDSTTTHREFGDDSRIHLVRLSRAVPCDEAHRLIKSMGGDDDDIARMFEKKLLLQVPGVFDALAFVETFRGMGLVTLTAGAATVITDDRALLYVPDQEGRTVEVSRLLYELILRSDGKIRLIHVLKELCDSDDEATFYLVEELFTKLIELFRAGLIGVVRVDQPPANALYRKAATALRRTAAKRLAR